jgi:hypothetical protein
MAENFIFEKTPQNVKKAGKNLHMGQKFKKKSFLSRQNPKKPKKFF